MELMINCVGLLSNKNHQNYKAEFPFSDCSLPRIMSESQIFGWPAHYRPLVEQVFSKGRADGYQPWRGPWQALALIATHLKRGLPHLRFGGEFYGKCDPVLTLPTDTRGVAGFSWGDAPLYEPAKPLSSRASRD